MAHVKVWEILNGKQTVSSHSQCVVYGEMHDDLSNQIIMSHEDVTGTKKLLKQHELNSACVLSQYEVKALMGLQHTNLLPPSDVLITEEFKYAVYEYESLNNLQNYLERKGRLTEKKLLNILNQIIEAYQFLKDNGLIHGNIKPTNILVKEDHKLTIKLTDFLFHSKKQEDYDSDVIVNP